MPPITVRQKGKCTRLEKARYYEVRLNGQVPRPNHTTIDGVIIQLASAETTKQLCHRWRLGHAQDQTFGCKTGSTYSDDGYLWCLGHDHGVL